MGRPWALSDDGKPQILALRKEGLGDKKIAGILGYSWSVIQRWLWEVEHTGSDEHRRWYQTSQMGQIGDLPRATAQMPDLPRAKVSLGPVKARPVMVRGTCWYCNRPIDGPFVQS
jgi:hypothetical protein